MFPFGKPLPPAEGDNQAAAYNTTDESTVDDVVFALVWATGDEVLNVNEAYAYASCSNCVTVAVAFQVVLIVDNAHVVVPQNLALAANYDCYQCITAAVANQLVLSVSSTPTEEKLVALRATWTRLLQFGNAITSYSLAQVTSQLEYFKAQIIAILSDAPATAPGTTPSVAPSAAPTTVSTEPSPSGPSSGTPGTTASPPPTATNPPATPDSSPATSSGPHDRRPAAELERTG